MSLVTLNDIHDQLIFSENKQPICDHTIEKFGDYVYWVEYEKKANDYICKECQDSWKSHETSQEIEHVRNVLTHLNPNDSEFFFILCNSFLNFLCPGTEPRRVQLASNFIQQQLQFGSSTERITTESLSDILRQPLFPTISAYATTVVNWPFADSYMGMALEYSKKQPYHSQLNEWYIRSWIRSKTSIDKEVMIWTIEGISLMRRLVDRLKHDATILGDRIRNGQITYTRSYWQIMNILINVIGCDRSKGWYLSLLERSMIIQKTPTQQTQLINAISHFDQICKFVYSNLKFGKIRLDIK